MLDWFKRTKLPDVWAIKQIDDDLLHVCGRGQLKSRERPSNVLTALEENRFEGAVHMHDSALVLNARLFAALVPVEDLILSGQDQAEWRSALFRVSWVPQRCWVYEDRLIATSVELNGVSQWISVEDTAAIRHKAAAIESDETSASFAALDALDERPTLDMERNRRR